MSFYSDDLESYLRILDNPNLGLRLFQQEERKHKYTKTDLDEAECEDDDEYIISEESIDSTDDESFDPFDSDKPSDTKVDSDTSNTSSDSKPSKSDSVEFQILDVDTYHRIDDDGGKHFDITLFGKTREGKSVFANVEGFTPYFFVEIDSRWRREMVDQLVNTVKKKVFPKEAKDGLLSYKIIKAHKFNGFTDDASFNFLHLVFKDYDAMRAYERQFSKKLSLPFISRQRKVSMQLYESNIHPMLRFMHIQNLEPIGWCKIDKSAMKKFTPVHRRGATDISVCCSWKNVQRVESADIHKFKILSFDLECTSGDGKFPQADRPDDKIIQIGMTYSYLGETECHRKIVLCLNRTDDIPGAEVVCFDDEAKLLLAFTEYIRTTDPDIITGYNVFGFDWPYLNKRAEFLKIQTKFNRLSRIRNQVCQFKEQKLQSSALGRNNLKYYITPGRVHIDLMKVIQRDHKLGGYKLDFVASTFIKDGVTGYQYIKETDPNIKEYRQILSSGINAEDVSDVVKKNRKKAMEGIGEDDCYSSDDEDDDDDNDDDDIHIGTKRKKVKNKDRIEFTRLEVKSTFGVEEDDFISVSYNDKVVNNSIGKKYRILKIEDIERDGKKIPTILVQGKVRVRPFLKRGKDGWKVFWSQAKDDIEPKDIFRFFKGTSTQRAKVAKYCLKDCSLCNRLMAMLQILPNNIGMGNVCNVPLSYLFLRGQGIKIYSLVAKQCREENYLIPTAKKKKFVQEPQRDENGNIVETEEQAQERKFQQFVESLMGKKNDEDDEEDEDEGSYEGATVFDPDKGVHMDPIFVQDYGSLYPSSMIQKNLSHNSIVLDDKYDNLPDYKYHSVTYNNPDGTTTTCRFAERKDGTKATIPRILMRLLSERNKCKKKMAIEKDPFKAAVWDGLQLAYKVTANSLYGQCGSSVSPIALRHIAACTTAIGREMLEIAKEFAEGPMKEIIDLINRASESGDDTKFLRYMRKFYKDVKDDQVQKKIPKKDADGNKMKDADGNLVMEFLYDGKEEFFQYIKREIYKLLGDYDIDPKCIYGDTDSVFVKLNMAHKVTKEKFRDFEALKTTIKVGIITSDIINYTLDSPQVLEYEKTYWPFIIISKKRYVGNLYGFTPDSYYQNSMGLVTKRRDNADIVKVVVGGIIDWILNKRDPEGAIKFTQDTLKKIITAKYNIDKFIITKTLKDKEDYKDWTKMVHMVVADRMGQRDPGNKPQANDRLPFAYVETKRKVKLQGDRAEHPKYILENNLKLDLLFYITNQIMKPALQFLELLCDNPDDIFHEYIMKETHRKNGQTPLMKHFQDCSRDHNNMDISFGGMSLMDMFRSEQEIRKEKEKAKQIEKQKARARTRVPKKRIV